MREGEKKNKEREGGKTKLVPDHTDQSGGKGTPETDDDHDATRPSHDYGVQMTRKKLNCVEGELICFSFAFFSFVFAANPNDTLHEKHIYASMDTYLLASLHGIIHIP